MKHLVCRLVAAAGCVLMSGIASAQLQGGDNSAGHRFLSGGITGEERAAMLAERGRYTLWVTTVARPSGAYLADVRLLIRSAAGAVVFERVMDGPWLFVTLPAGRYQIEGTLHEPGAAEQTLRVTVSVPAQGQRQAVLRFASDAEVAPDDSGAAKFNPFEGAPGSVPR